MRSVLSRWIVGVVVAFLLLCPHLRIYMNETTRYYSFWGRQDALALAASVGLLGTLLFVVHGLVRALKVTWLSGAVNAAFVVVVGFSVVAYVRTSVLDGAQPWAKVSLVASACFVTVLGAGSLMPRLAKIPRVLQAACLIVSPVVPLVFVQLLCYADFSVGSEILGRRDVMVSTRSHPPEQGTSNVYLFIFDEWSHERTFERSDFDIEFPHIARLMRTATLYHNAHSPHRSTSQSLPAVLFQTTRTYVYAGGRVGFEDSEGDFVTARERESLFSQADAAGFNTYLVGWYHPYRLMFGPDLDYCWSSPSSAQTVSSDTLLGRTAGHLQIGLGKSILAIPKPAALQWRAARLFQRSESEHAIETTKDIHNLALTIIRHQTGPSLAVFHYTVPHWPFVYDRDGLNPNASTKHPLYFGLDDDRERSVLDPVGYIERYNDNLRYTDTLVGELIDAMVSAGCFAESTIILTSDHTWRDEPALGDHPTVVELTHVPLIVKSPHQSEPEEIVEPFSLVDLRRVMRPLESSAHVSRHRHVDVPVDGS